MKPYQEKLLKLAGFKENHVLLCAVCHSSIHGIKEVIHHV